VHVIVKSVQVEHTVQMQEFKKWLERTGRSPVEVLRRKRIREILGTSRESAL
jgi:hypothetical protein